MFRLATGLGLLALAATPAWAVDLPSDTIERAVVCSVYGGFAPGDLDSLAAKDAIDETVQDALDRGLLTASEMRATINETTQAALYEEPRAEVTANWDECRATFAP
jgi:hypothetical protein